MPARVAAGGLGPGTPVEVVGQGCELTFANGWFSDDFPLLAEHVYKISK